MEARHAQPSSDSNNNHQQIPQHSANIALMDLSPDARLAVAARGSVMIISVNDYTSKVRMRLVNRQHTTGMVYVNITSLSQAYNE